MAVKKEYSGKEEFVKAILAANVREAFIYELTTKKQGGPVIRLKANDAGIPNDPIIMSSVEMTSMLLLSAEEVKTFGPIKENYFYLFEETLQTDLIVNEEEEQAFKGETEKKIGEVFKLFAEKCPEITLVKGRTIPA